MKTFFKTIIIIAMLVAPAVAFASVANPSGLDDTIPASPRCEKYYYTKWFDECPNYYPNGVVDSCLCRFLQYHNFYPEQSVAKWEHTNQRMRVKGLVAMVSKNLPPTNDNDSIITKLPEYLYLYQVVGRHYALLQSQGIMDGLDLQLLDSVRWDTATARVMELRRGWNGEFTQYCYLYEAYFKQPVYVDSDFYIYGSTNSNVHKFPGSSQWLYETTNYVDIMDFGAYAWSPKCADPGWISFSDFCTPTGGYVAIVDQLMPQMGWYSPWPDSPWGYYLPIVDQWNLEAVPNDTAFGEVLGGGRFIDGSYDTIEAIPAPGYFFHSWNDGNTDNPRVIHLTSDTSFVAIFYANEMYSLQVVSSDETLGSVAGGGTFHGETDNTITATPNYGCRFLNWNDGMTDNPRVVHLVGDTSFTAYFAEKAHYNVHTATNNDEWGSVEGGGVYMEGEEAVLTVTTEQFCIFEGWSDGVWELPRIVTVTQDTLFTALFSYDSTWAAGIDMAGTLEFTVSPNPTNGRLTIMASHPGRYEITLFDMNGKILSHKKTNEPAFELDLSPFPAGQYFLMLRSKDKYGTKTIVKK